MHHYIRKFCYKTSTKCHTSWDLSGSVHQRHALCAIHLCRPGRPAGPEWQIGLAWPGQDHQHWFIMILGGPSLQLSNIGMVQCWSAWWWRPHRHGIRVAESQRCPSKPHLIVLPGSRGPAPRRRVVQRLEKSCSHSSRTVIP